MEPNKQIDYGVAYTEMVIHGLRERQTVRTIFSGRSMTPTLREGMQILLERTEPDRINPADIIMYRKADRAIVHRVIGIIRKDRTRLFVTKGDNHAYIDCDYIPESDLIGKVAAAFFENDRETNVLVKSRIVGGLYVALGNMVLYIRRARKYVPSPIRSVFKYFVGSFFFLFKKTTHAIYLGMRYGQLFFGRRDRKSAST